MAGIPSIQTTPSVERFDETVSAENKTGYSFPGLKKRFQPDFANSEDEKRHVALAMPNIVKETAELMMTCLHGHDISNKTALFVIGATGSGKSSLCNWLVGHDLAVATKEVENDFGSTTVKELDIKFVQGVPQFDISGENKSKTFVPSLYELHGQDKVLIDFPGFFDTSAFDIRIGMDLGFRRILNAFGGRAQIIALVAIQNFDTSAARGVSGKEQLQKMRRLVPTSTTPVPQRLDGAGSRFCVGVSRCDNNFALDAMKLWTNMEAQVKDLDDVMATSIWNANKHMLKIGKNVMTPTDFLQDLDRNYRVQENIQSDCLDVTDIELFADYLKSDDYTSHLLSVIMKSVGVETCENVVDEEDSMPEAEKKEIMDKQNVEELIAKAGKISEQVKVFATWMSVASANLVNNGTLALENVDETFHWMQEQKQPRLTRALAHVELALMQKVIARAIETHKKLETQMQELINAEVIIDEDAVKVKEAISEDKANLDGLVASLGYKSSQGYTTAVLAGGAAVVAVGGGVATVTVLVSASAYAVAGLCTGGVSCLIVGGVAAIVGFAAKMKADEVDRRKKLSSELSVLQIEASRQHVLAAKNATAHEIKLTAKVTEMSLLTF